MTQTSIEADNAALREALRPFANIMAIPMGCADSTKVAITVEAGDLRRARDVLGDADNAPQSHEVA